jgi:hypothetical protein
VRLEHEHIVKVYIIEAIRVYAAIDTTANDLYVILTRRHLTAHQDKTATNAGMNASSIYFS